MKTWKRRLGIALLAMVVVFTLSVPVFAGRGGGHHFRSHYGHSYYRHHNHFRPFVSFYGGYPYSYPYYRSYYPYSYSSYYPYGYSSYSPYYSRSYYPYYSRPYYAPFPFFLPPFSFFIRF